MSNLSPNWESFKHYADLTRTEDRRDEFKIANWRVWWKYFNLSRERAILSTNRTEKRYALSRFRPSNPKPQEGTTAVQSLLNSRTGINKINTENKKLCVQDVIPNSRLARFYGEFYYDEDRELSYTHTQSYSSNDPESTNHMNKNKASEPIECWMLPEVDYWFHKLSNNDTTNNTSCSILPFTSLCNKAQSHGLDNRAESKPQPLLWMNPYSRERRQLDSYDAAKDSAPLYAIASAEEKRLNIYLNSMRMKSLWLSPTVPVSSLRPGARKIRVRLNRRAMQIGKKRHIAEEADLLHLICKLMTSVKIEKVHQEEKMHIAEQTVLEVEVEDENDAEEPMLKEFKH